MTKEQEELEKRIDELELHDMETSEIEKVVKTFSEEGLMIRRNRKKVRYQLYRIQKEFLGGPASGSTDEFKKKFETDPNFGGWRFFGITWDVSMEDPYRCVHRDKSISQEWDELVRAKYPSIEPGTGRVIYPDIVVRKKVEEESKRQGLLKPVATEVEKTKKKTKKKKG